MNTIKQLINGRGKATFDIARAINIPVWWIATYLLWEITQQNKVIIGVLKALAKANNIEVIGD